jgi:hypothetical protein
MSNEDMASEAERRTVCREFSGTYHLPSKCHIWYQVQSCDPGQGVQVSYKGGVNRDTDQSLREFQLGVCELVAQRLGEGIELVGIDIVIEFLGGCSMSSSGTHGYAFMYDVVEAETTPLDG